MKDRIVPNPIEEPAKAKTTYDMLWIKGLYLESSDPNQKTNLRVEIELVGKKNTEYLRAPESNTNTSLIIPDLFALCETDLTTRVLKRKGKTDVDIVLEDIVEGLIAVIQELAIERGKL